jgi:hypothetical protein
MIDTMIDRLGELARDLEVLLRHHRAEALEEAARIADDVESITEPEGHFTAVEIGRRIRALIREEEGR